MKTLITTLFLSLSIASPVMAGGGHSHDGNGGHNTTQVPISSEQAINRASETVKQLSRAGKIDSSWSGVKASSVEQKEYQDGPEWIISFKNDKVKDPSKQTLYVFYSLDGYYIGANYSGN
jgi:hypothetical protein